MQGAGVPIDSIGQQPAQPHCGRRESQPGLQISFLSFPFLSLFCRTPSLILSQSDARAAERVKLLEDKAKTVRYFAFDSRDISLIALFNFR